MMQSPCLAVLNVLGNDLDGAVTAMDTFAVVAAGLAAEGGAPVVAVQGRGMGARLRHPAGDGPAVSGEGGADTAGAASVELAQG